VKKKVEEQAEEIHRTLLYAMSALSFALEAKDAYTAGHSRRVADIATAIGKAFGLSEDELEDLRWAALLHDIGKNLVSMMLEGAGFEVTDLGVDVPAERFVQAIREVKPHFLSDLCHMK
jgi:hypothetical protein